MKKLDFGEGEITAITLNNGEVYYNRPPDMELGICGAYFAAVTDKTVFLFPQSAIAHIQIMKAEAEKA